jgi:protease-4
MFAIFKWKWVVFALLIVSAVSYMSRLVAEPEIGDGSFLVVEIRGSYGEGPPNTSLTRLIEDRQLFVELLSNLKKASNDSRIAGVIARIGSLEVGWAQADEIRSALEDVSKAGKQVVAYVDSDAMTGNREYFIASVAETVYIPPAGSPMLTGLAANYLFFGGLWEELDIKIDVEQIGEYKTFGDTISRRTMTPAHRDMVNWILDDVHEEFVTTIAQSRGLTTREMTSVIDSCPSTPGDFVASGLADKVAFMDEVLTELGDGERVTIVSESIYSRIQESSVGLGGGPKIAVIHAAGSIVSGRGGSRSAFGVTVGSDTLSKAFRDAAENPEIKAIVFRIDSPGGSAMASDQVWHATRLARQRKPVLASLGDVAASGGYYMAAGADKIVAAPATLTGSIGVVLLKPDISGLLEKWGIGSETIARGRYARIMDTTKGFDRAELALIRDQMDAVYTLFLDRVAEGRGMTIEEVDRIGKGRVWTGHQALDHGLVDSLGGLSETIRLAATEAGIEEFDTIEIVHLPERRNVLDELGTLYDSNTESMIPRILMKTLGELSVYANFDVGVHALVSGALEIR